MGFSLKKLVPKAISKPLSSVVKGAGNTAKGVTGGLGKVVKGDIKGGLGDISQTAVKFGLDQVTLGNSKKLDGLSGGLVTSIEGAARGNSTDIARLGITAGAAYATGGMGAFAVNSSFAGGGSNEDALLSGISNSTGADMEWLKTASTFINSPIGNTLATSLLPKSKPAAPPAAPQIVYQAAAPVLPVPNGLSSKMMMMIGGGVIALVLIIALVFRKK